MSIQVSLAPGGMRPRPAATTRRPPYLLRPPGARVVLGGGAEGEPFAPLRAGASIVFGPRGACMVEAGGPLLVCDTGHHRLLLWSVLPDCDEAAADLLIGQPNFESEGRNGNGE